MKAILFRTIPALVFASVLSVGACASMPTATASASSATQQVSVAPVTRDQVLAAQNAWGDALVKISTPMTIQASTPPRRPPKP